MKLKVGGHMVNGIVTSVDTRATSVAKSNGPHGIVTSVDTNVATSRGPHDSDSGLGERK